MRTCRRHPVFCRTIKNEAPRGAFLIVLLLAVSGCSTTRTAFLPPDEADPMSGWGDEIHLVKPGMSVTIILKSGMKVKGEVVEVTSDEIVLGKSSNLGFQKDRYPAEDIERIEFPKATGTAGFIAGLVVGMSVMFSLLLIGLTMTGPVIAS